MLTVKHSAVLLIALATLIFGPVATASVRLKDIARVEGVRSNPLVGYGIVVGLSGSGDSGRSRATVQSIGNALLQFGVSVDERDINSRNVAAVMVTAEMPPFSSAGDRLDLNVSSLGDARSLVGGTLVLTPLKGANDRIYALAQGQVSVGGFQYDLNGNMVQKNHTTVGRIPDGATVEVGTDSIVMAGNSVDLVLLQPDFTTADRIVRRLSTVGGVKRVTALHPGKIKVEFDSSENWVSVVGRLENIAVDPDTQSVVVVNERTGTVVSGGNVRIDNVTVSHGELKVVISTDYNVSQPSFIGRASGGVQSIVVPDTEISVEEQAAQAVAMKNGSTVAELITALRQIKVSTRDVIVILQAIKAAGALNAKLIIQ